MRGAKATWCVAALLLGAGCQRCDEADGAGAREQAGAAGAEQRADRARSASGEPGPAPVGVRISAEPGRYREIGISIEARGPGVVRLRRELAVERATEAGFERVEARLTLRPDCATEPPECVELAPGAELLPPPYLGSLGDAQCGCADCRPAPPGRYRFVATSCDGAHRIESEPFALGD